MATNSYKFKILKSNIKKVNDVLIPLYFFESKLSEIKINQYIKIIKLNPALRELVKSKLYIQTQKITHAIIVNSYLKQNISAQKIMIIIRLFKKGNICHNGLFSFDAKKQNIKLLSFPASILSYLPKISWYRIESQEKNNFIKFCNKIIDLLPYINKNFPNLEEALLQFDYSYTNNFWDIIINYSIVFEALLIKEGEKEGITHKLANRLSYLIANSFEERKVIFQFAKKFYDIRSKIIHGSRRKIENTSNILELSENVIRKVFERYFLLINHFKTMEEIINYLDDLILGKKPINGHV